MIKFRETIEDYSLTMKKKTSLVDIFFMIIANLLVILLIACSVAAIYYGNRIENPVTFFEQVIYRYQTLTSRNDVPFLVRKSERLLIFAILSIKCNIYDLAERSCNNHFDSYPNLPEHIRPDQPNGVIPTSQQIKDADF